MVADTDRQAFTFIHNESPFDLYMCVAAINIVKALI